jgi:hypothetical protein
MTKVTKKIVTLSNLYVSKKWLQKISFIIDGNKEKDKTVISLRKAVCTHDQ